MKKIIIVALIAVVVIFFYKLGFDQYLSLEGIKQGQQNFAQLNSEKPLLVALSFFVIYIVATALSLPGAAVLTLAAGAFFGLFWGTLLVSFASSIGATLAFLVARFLLRDSAQKKFGQKLQSINEGISKEGAFYLFTLRLVPLFPFFMINLLMGLTPIKTITFYWVSQIGMFAGTIVFVNAGTQLAQIDTLSGILSPGLIFSFVLLGIFPIIAKKIVEQIKKRQVYSTWKKPQKFDRNIVVIGGGTAGLISSYIGVIAKAKVTLVEAHKMGGDCLNYGCVPSKALIKSAKVAEQMKNAQRYGLQPVDSAFSFKEVMARVHHIVKTIEPHDSVERYTNLGVDVVEGFAKIVDPWTVEITQHDGEKKRLTTRSIIIAAGAKPFVPNIPGIEETGYLTSDTLWHELAKLDEIPKRMVLLGGGPIGCELAQSFARLGANVSQVEMLPRVMIREDEDVSILAKQALENSGVNVLTDHKALRCRISDGRKFLTLEHDNKEVEIEFDVMICAVGRVARLNGYGLEDIGVDTEKTVITNEYLQTIYPNIYAAGDVAGPFQFTHTAAHQAWYAAVNALFGEFKKFKADYTVIPWTTFLDPEIARVGLNEQEAKEQGIDYEVTQYDLKGLDRAIAESSNAGFVKVLTPPGKDKILGVTIVGIHAGDLLAEFVLAMKHGLGLNKILGTIHTYPTLAEANKSVAGMWKKKHTPVKLLSYVEKYQDWKRG